MDYSKCYLDRDSTLFCSVNQQGVRISDDVIEMVKTFQSSKGWDDGFIQAAIKASCFSVKENKLVFWDRECKRTPESRMAEFLNLGALLSLYHNERHYTNGIIATESNNHNWPKYEVRFSNGSTLDVLELNVSQLFEHRWISLSN